MYLMSTELAIDRNVKYTNLNIFKIAYRNRWSQETEETTEEWLRNMDFFFYASKNRRESLDGIRQMKAIRFSLEGRHMLPHV